MSKLTEAMLKGLPEGTTHVACVDVYWSKGKYQMRFDAVKFVDGEAMVHNYDSDDEYPQWVRASRLWVNMPTFISIKEIE